MEHLAASEPDIFVQSWWRPKTELKVTALGNKSLNMITTLLYCVINHSLTVYKPVIKASYCRQRTLLANTLINTQLR